MATHFGFVGLGNMGGPMAERLVAGGQPVTVFDIDERAQARLVACGASGAGSAQALAGEVDVVLGCLPSVSAARAVVESVCAAGGARTYVEMSTIGLDAARAHAARCAEHGIAMVDAPVSGGGEAARRGVLTIMVSGPEAAVASARPALETIGKRVIEISPEQGMAQVMKLLNNLCILSSIGITLEACAFGVKAGLDPTKMLEVLNASSGRSGASRFVAPQVVGRTFDTGASMAIAYKDVALCVAEAERIGVPMWLGAAAAQLWRHGVIHAGGEADMSHLADLLESWSQVEIKA